MSFTITPLALARIYHKNMLMYKNADDITDVSLRKVVQKLKGIREWESPTDPVQKSYVEIQKQLIQTIIGIQSTIDSSSN